MTLHRPLRASFDGLTAVAIAAAFMAAAPTGAASAAGFSGAGVGNGAAASSAASSGQASNGSGYEPSETDCVTIAQQPGRSDPDQLAACGVIAPVGGNGYYQPRG